MSRCFLRYVPGDSEDELFVRRHAVSEPRKGAEIYHLDDLPDPEWHSHDLQFEVVILSLDLWFELHFGVLFEPGAVQMKNAFSGGLLGSPNS